MTPPYKLLIQTLRKLAALDGVLRQKKSCYFL
jgi:hypothetical protein